jgi:hypothetical protein
MTSGTQGLTVGYYNGSSSASGGVYLTFSENLSYFSATFQINGSNPSPIVVLFATDGSIAATYAGGVTSGIATYFGVEIKDVNVTAVWIGDKANGNGFIIDDVAFSFERLANANVPEPSTLVMIFGLSGLAATLFLRRKYQN